MKNPGFQFRLRQLLGASIFALAATLLAEPPATAPETRAVKTPPPRGNKPQVIYHVRPASNYAATLHAQEKTQDNDLPVDNSMPTSLQLSRANANAAAAEARARQEAAERQRQSKRPKAHKKQTTRSPMSVKSKGHGKGHKH